MHLYEALLEIDGHTNGDPSVKRSAKDGGALRPADITSNAQQDPRCAKAIEHFCGLYGSVCGNLALSYGALGGVYLGGGVALSLGDLFDEQAFLERFVAKGRFRSYLSRIPVSLVVRPDAALLGASRYPLSNS